MKKILRTSAFLLLAGMAVTSCVMQRSVSESQSANNPDYRVSYLFEHDGCRVYRFYDSWSGSYVYFTTQGDVTAIPNEGFVFAGWTASTGGRGSCVTPKWR